MRPIPAFRLRRLPSPSPRSLPRRSGCPRRWKNPRRTGARSSPRRSRRRRTSRHMTSFPEAERDSPSPPGPPPSSSLRTRLVRCTCTHSLTHSLTPSNKIGQSVLLFCVYSILLLLFRPVGFRRCPHPARALVRVAARSPPDFYGRAAPRVAAPRRHPDWPQGRDADEVPGCLRGPNQHSAAGRGLAHPARGLDRDRGCGNFDIILGYSHAFLSATPPPRTHAV